MKNGVPYHIAMKLDAEERAAYSVIIAGFTGAQFDWSTMKWNRHA